MNRKRIIVLALFSFLVFSFVGFTFKTYAQSASVTPTIDDLQSKIDAKSADISQLQKEIDQYSTQVTQVAGQAQTLSNTIKALDLTAKKLAANIALTQAKINQANLTIQQLSGTIDTTKTHIGLNQQALGETLRTVYETEDQSTLENLFTFKTFTDLWDALEKNRQFEREVQAKSTQLVSLKTDLTVKKTTQESAKTDLMKLQQDLSDQQKIVKQNSQEKATLLAQTKNQESTYRKILADKQTLVNQYEKDLFDYEAQLHLITSPSEIPLARHDILSWPLDKVYITQLFGVTQDSARLYVSGSHNGVDFRAPIGTPVKAALGGVIAGTGNTDAFPGCYSFGRWVMIKHPGGLSTIYAHLSLIKVDVGQNVSTGDIIGLSGYSGYVSPAGPAGAHLHLGVYATAGVQIKQFTQSIGCKQAIVPIADIKAYLDPMLYLPVYQ